MQKQGFIQILKEASRIMTQEREHLIELDSVVGDGDLGLTMSDGFLAAYQDAAACADDDCGKVLYAAGKAMSTAVPSTMGTLMASGLMAAGKQLRGKPEEDVIPTLAAFCSAYLDGVMARGKAQRGEKTFVDGLAPAVDVLCAAVEADAPADVLARAKDAAWKGYEDTETMLAIHGRAATRGEASRTLRDPGAYVAYLLVSALPAALS